MTTLTVMRMMETLPRQPVQQPGCVSAAVDGTMLTADYSDDCCRWRVTTSDDDDDDDDDALKRTPMAACSNKHTTLQLGTTISV